MAHDCTYPKNLGDSFHQATSDKYMVHCMLKTNVIHFFCSKHRLFEIQPRAKQAFGFDKGEVNGQAHADVHAKAFAGVFDSVFQMLGPDQEFIEEMLKQIGKRHKAMGVNASFFPFMVHALTDSMEEFMARKLTDQERDAWEHVFDVISGEIIKVILN